MAALMDEQAIVDVGMSLTLKKVGKLVCVMPLRRKNAVTPQSSCVKKISELKTRKKDNIFE